VSPTPSAVVLPGHRRARRAGRLGSARSAGGLTRLAGGLVAVVAVLFGPAGLAAAGRTSSAAGWLSELAGPACASAAGTNPVGLVIDFGNLDGRVAHVSRDCVSFGSGGTGFDLLKADGHTFRINAAGLVCAIDGYPSPDAGCGQHTASGYRYWSFWHAEANDPGVWQYASFGPASHRPGAGSVEGWHYVEGAGNPSDPPPGASALSPCPAGPPATSAPTTVPAAPPPAGGAANSGGSPGGSPAGASAADSTSSSVDDAQEAIRAGAELDQSGATTGGASDGSDQNALGPDAPVSTGAGTGSGVPVAVILVGLAIVALGTVAVVRSRSRTRAES
jgi:hypothetical protein